MSKFLSILSGTPTWVFFVFAYLMFVGIRATKDRKIHIGKMFLVAPDFCIEKVVAEMLPIAKRLRAIIVADCPTERTLRHSLLLLHARAREFTRFIRR